LGLTTTGQAVARPRRRAAATVRRQAEEVGEVSKDLSDTSNRKKLKKSSFALPEEEKYPIPDIEHARNALARVAQHGTAAEKKKVRAAVEKRYPSLKKDD
jgi:hypothetical protein